MKGFGLSSTSSTIQPRPRSRRSAGALHPGTADELVLDEMVSSLSLYGVVMRQRK
jgi:hypothetical protein